jgi:hypothetical protein
VVTGPNGSTGDWPDVAIDAARSPGAGWQPAGPVEADLYEAVRAGDQRAFLTALAGGLLVLPISPEADAGREPLGWATGLIDGLTHLIAFTSVEALYEVVPADPLPFRLATMADLAANWPDPRWWLALNPGLPIEARIAPAELADLPPPTRVAGDAELATAIQATDPDGFMAALMRAELLVPVRPDGSPSRDLTDPDFPWWTMRDETGQPTIVAFTGAAWLGLVLGDADHVVVSMPQLARAWPNPGVSLAINPGTALAGTLPGDAVRELGSWLSELGAAVVEEIERRGRPEAPADSGEPPGSAEAVDVDPAAPRVLQMLIPPTYVSAYLEHGYGLAAGVVHLARVGETPAGLYRRLGMLGAGSPFGETDPSVAVLRWEPGPDTPPDLGTEPGTASVRVPARATLHRLHHDGRDELLARYTDGWWVPTGPAEAG